MVLFHYFFSFQQPPKKRRPDLPTPEKAMKSRWKRKNVDKSALRKMRRNLGSSYTNQKGHKIEARTLGPPCGCKKNCRILLQGTEENIFDAFWALGDFHKQNAYLFYNMKQFPKKRVYPKKQKKAVSTRKYSVNYHVKVNGVEVTICKKEFLAVHGLHNSQKRIQLLQKQMSEGSTTPKLDQRGKHCNRANKISEEACQSVRDHIKSIPKYTSHYSRQKNPDKTYIDHDLTISSLYHDYYKAWCNDQNITPASQDKYRRIFCSEFNIGFKLPRSDTCKICDSLHVQLQNSKENVDVCKQLQTELELHQRRAEAMQKSLKDEVELAASRDTYIISFDLQQALPVPNLTTGPAFYLRKAWVYNLGIHDCVNNKGFMYMWSENIGKRGSDEIASILYKHFKAWGPFPKNLIVYTDNCGGQNKNWVIVSLWKQLIAENMFDTIEHRFLVVGHTHLPSDRDFAIIEKHKKKLNAVYDPEDWYNAVKNCKRNNPFQVTIMKLEDFYSFKFLEETISKKKVTEQKGDVSFSKICVFRFENDNINIMKIKHLLNENFKNVNIGKRGLRKLSLPDNLKQKYTEPVRLNDKKLHNLGLLLPYIPQVKHKFYLDLGVKNMNPQGTEIDTDNVENMDETSALSDDCT